jgi:hypothetical protein
VTPSINDQGIEIAMGNFYTNITLRCADRPAIEELLAREHRAAFVGGTGQDTVIYDRQSDQEIAPLEPLADSLSRSFSCAALAVLNHDDDILQYFLYEAGRKIDEYVSAPGYFDGTTAPPAGGVAEALCRVFGRASKQAEVARTLHPPDGRPAEVFVFASQQHQRLLQLLGLPEIAVATGYTYLDRGEFPPGSAGSDFIRIADP